VALAERRLATRPRHRVVVEVSAGDQLRALAQKAQCCDEMAAELAVTCPMHENRNECPDALVARYNDGTYGILIHDGGSSIREIAWCPWCGSPLHRFRALTRQEPDASTD
jgi:hypothetical protein